MLIITNSICAETLRILKQKPTEISDLSIWLFITINTAKAMIINSAPTQVVALDRFLADQTTSQIQATFDQFQGQFGADNFSMRHSQNYKYLCMLIANFPEQIISKTDKAAIKSDMKVNQYLLYLL
ncbi:hypothetical protein ACNAN0_02605 [Agrilactobacillus fermenti]|uniref:hypothetical protein n=1 Tax=Agrilactobacillus fermenti TaxID=2586909 RepID=UPI001E2950DB|nr:hypothetical protein [Agrilactobacillus fermenti]MCD2256393.1 hypothetical protein [Agrilactobacillus fermenti]